MSSSEEDNNEPGSPVNHNNNSTIEIAEPDDDTMRVMLSTDNHLGYLEQDAVRGLDSFAAFEEVLYLAKMHKVDMVLLAGDLFHANKPSRRTLYKTMEIIRKYTMGPNPVKIQILSDQSQNFRNVSDSVNYEDEYYSVDLPIFSIHGNHDDPTRDGGQEMLAALDLLSVSNLVNYFGRHDEVNKVEISPILMQKGQTKVALYGMGSMRDERLNRMWQQKNVRFLRPEGAEEEDDGDDDDENHADWFNMFVLHQNRDLGRGSKNCVHESMLPAFCDLIVWGHEHACEILPAESLVGTFRITQPGSSVATSLTAGEAVRKHCAILNIRGGQFKIEPIPLSMVRSFVTRDVLLGQHANLDPEDPKVDDKISKILEGELRMCIHNAREKSKELLKDAREKNNDAADEDSPLKYKLEKRDEVLVRLRVEHTGFTTLNNQRFGAKFVGQVANPTDILLFSKSKAKAVGTSGSKKRKAANALEEVLDPEELENDIRVPDLVKEFIDSSDQKLELLKEKKLKQALEEYVEKGELRAIAELVERTMEKRERSIPQKKNGEDNDEDGGDDDDNDEETSQAEKRAAKRKRDSLSDDDDDDGDAPDKENVVNDKSATARGKGKAPQKKKSASRSSSKSPVSVDSDDDDDDMESDKPGKSKKSSGWQSKSKSKTSSNSRRSSGDIRSFAVSKASSQSQASKATKSSSRKKAVDEDDDDFGDDSSIEVVSPPKRAAPKSRRTTKARVNYSVDLSDEEVVNSDSDDFMDEAPPKKAAKKTGKAAGRGKSSQGRKKTQESSTYDEIDLDDSNWGSATTKSQSTRK